MQDQVFTHVGDAVEYSMLHAQKRWRDSWARGTRLQDLLAEAIGYVETVSTQRPGGRLEILVRVIAKRPHQREMYFYKFVRDAGVWSEQHPF